MAFRNIRRLFRRLRRTNAPTVKKAAQDPQVEKWTPKAPHRTVVKGGKTYFFGSPEPPPGGVERRKGGNRRSLDPENADRRKVVMTADDNPDDGSVFPLPAKHAVELTAEQPQRGAATDFRDASFKEHNRTHNHMLGKRERVASVGNLREAGPRRVVERRMQDERKDPAGRRKNALRAGEGRRRTDADGAGSAGNSK